MSKFKIIPDQLMSVKGGIRPVTNITTDPLNPLLPPESPIRKELTMVVCHLDNGESRYFGYEQAAIGPDLRMHVGPINPRDEVQMAWEDSDFLGEDHG